MLCLAELTYFIFVKPVYKEMTGNRKKQLLVGICTLMVPERSISRNVERGRRNHPKSPPLNSKTCPYAMLGCKHA